MLGASSASISYLAPFPVPWRESQAWEDEMGNLGSDAGLPVFLKPHALELEWQGPSTCCRHAERVWGAWRTPTCTMPSGFCPARHPDDGACGPLSFSQQSYLYSSPAEVLIISKHTWSDTAASGHIPFHLVRISLFFVCKPPTHPFKLTFSVGPPQLPQAKFVISTPVLPKLAPSQPLDQALFSLPRQTVSQLPGLHLYFTVFITLRGWHIVST